VIEALDRFVLRRADLVVPMGRYTAERARAVGVPDEKMLVRPFPPAWRDRTAPPQAEETRDEQLVVCGARLEREKGIDVLITAFREVLEQCPDARLCIAGEGPRRKDLERLAEQLGVTSQVEFTGWLAPDQMWRLFASAGIAVLPSRWEEGLGMMLVEAGLAGCALVASDLGGMRDVVHSGESGLLVPPEDAGALADALIYCLTRPEDRDRFESAAREIAVNYVEQREAALREFSKRMDELRSG
jgi:glycosyltransferase involved in cell wall biosynthesis